MAAKFSNPPLARIDPELLVTVDQLVERLGVEPVTIRQWQHTGKIEPVPLGPGPQLYYLPAVAEAEYDAWLNGADRPARGGRPPGWRPGQRAERPLSAAA